MNIKFGAAYPFQERCGMGLMRPTMNPEHARGKMGRFQCQVVVTLPIIQGMPKVRGLCCVADFYFAYQSDLEQFMVEKKFMTIKSKPGWKMAVMQDNYLKIYRGKPAQLILDGVDVDDPESEVVKPQTEIEEKVKEGLPHAAVVEEIT